MDWKSIGAAIEQRKKDLGRSWAEISRRAPIDPAQLYRLRTGEGAEGKVSTDKMRDLDRALDWDAGTLEAIGEGNPPPTVKLTMDQRLVRLETEVSELRDSVAEVSAAVRKLTDQLSERVNEG